VEKDTKPEPPPSAKRESGSATAGESKEKKTDSPAAE
jgi:hypothetical protein